MSRDKNGTFVSVGAQIDFWRGNSWGESYYGLGEIDTDSPVAPEESETPVAPEELKTENKLSDEKITEVRSEVENVENGGTIQVDMGDATVMPKDILEVAKGKDVNIVLQMNGYTWTINGKSILSTNPVEQISLTHEGDFGFTASLTLNVGSQYMGKNGNLYYYDSDGKMVFMNAGKIDAGGNVSLNFSHASEYAIVITDNSENTQNTENNGNTSNPTASSNNTSAKEPEKIMPKTGDAGMNGMFYYL